MVYRLLTTLMNEGFARRDAEGRVHLGFGVLVLAQAVQPLLRAAAVPTLRRLAEEVGATAHLTVAEGDDGLAVAVVEPSWTNMHVAYREGSRHPLAKGAAGQAIQNANLMLGLPETAGPFVISVTGMVVAAALNGRVPEWKRLAMEFLAQLPNGQARLLLDDLLRRASAVPPAAHVEPLVAAAGGAARGSGLAVDRTRVGGTAVVGGSERTARVGSVVGRLRAGRIGRLSANAFSVSPVAQVQSQNSGA